MLFYLDLVDELLSVPNAALTSAISDLIRAHRLGHHLAIITRPCASWLRDNLDLSRSDDAMVARIAQDYAQTGDLHRRANIFIRLSAEPTLDLSINGNAINVSIQRLVQYRLLDPAILLIENMESDGGLYRLLLENNCHFHHCDCVAFELHHGGGADLPMVFGYLIADRRIVCGITDSDKHAPTSSDRKLDQLAHIKETANWPFCFPMSPPCREAENMIPFELVMALPSGMRNPTNAVQLRIKREELARGVQVEDRYWNFFDIKEGLNPDRFERMLPEEGNWIRAKLEFSGVDPEQKSVTGYGDSVIRQILDENKYVSELRNLTRHSSWRNVFSRFFDELVWVLAATPKIIT